MRATATAHRFAVRATRLTHAAVRVGEAHYGLHCTDRTERRSCPDRKCPRGVRCLPALQRIEHGFLRVVCEHCRAERLVAYSCKKRGLCPSCARGAWPSRRGIWWTGVRPAGAAMGAEFPYPLRFLFAGKPDAISRCWASCIV